jgi:predicted alpha/beta-hydrolase family hydrolase
VAEVLSSVEWAEGQAVTTRLFVGDRGPSILMAHGAGTNHDHSSIQSIVGGLHAEGRSVATFNYPYTERGSRRPDRAPKLLECHGQVLAWAKGVVGSPIVMAGRSMGGRMATMLAAAGADCAGIILFSYPLHPAGKPEKLRVEHLPDVKVPMLFISGTRDPLCDLALLDEHVRPLPNATIRLIGDGDHSMKVRLKSGRNSDAAHSEVMKIANDWLEGLNP